MLHMDAYLLLVELNENGIGGAIFPSYTREDDYCILLENFIEFTTTHEVLQWIELSIGLQKLVGVSKD